MKKTVIIFCVSGFLAIIIIMIMLGVTGCGDNGDSEGYNPIIIPSKFSTNINNTYLTMTPGTTFTYEGETEDGTETTVVEVTRNIRRVMRVNCVVVRDRVYLNGELIEDTFDWFAQDDMGNVWYFGEDSKELEDGVVVSTEGSWEAGVNGAKPGIVMQGNPMRRNRYRQEYRKGIAEDMAEVIDLDQSVTVPYGMFHDCLQTEEWSPLEPGVSEYKYYSATVRALVKEMKVGGTETVELISITYN